MVLGTQWYILFNVIAGAWAFPTECATPRQLDVRDPLMVAQSRAARHPPTM